MITCGTRTVMGNSFIGENALPKFRNRNHMMPLDGQKLLPEELEGYGYETGDRCLPYKWQDLFSRKLVETAIKTIVLENDYIRAEFWPDYGMRLASLIRKEDGCELLFSNPVLQFSNLAIRRAWFSGGIEWNCGQRGHTFTTCSPLFVAKMADETGDEFLRAFEFERQKGLYWSIDFHLGKDDRYLWAYARIVNPRKEAVPFYWWTNIAVPEEKGMRIFSGTSEVIYIDADSFKSENAVRIMAHGKLPFLNIKPGVDYSYPENFSDYSNEYFFQNSRKLSQTWEAAAYQNGHVFFDRSDTDLAYHKMFCWGGGNGGRHWRKFLSPGHDGNYVELQAGYCRTQSHGCDIKAESEIDFVQVFGAFDGAAYIGDGDYNERRAVIYEKIDSLISESEINKRKELYRKDKTKLPDCFISYGSGFGALETLRDSSSVPSGFFFPADSIRGEAEPWLRILNGEGIRDEEIPVSFMTDLRWLPYLESAKDKNKTLLNLIGVMYLENEMDTEAEACFQAALDKQKNAFSLRCLSVMAQQQGNVEEAVSLMNECVFLDNRREYCEEYADILVAAERWKELWTFYNNLPDAIKEDERLMLSVIPAACALKQISFLDECYSKNFAVIREGERKYTDCYFVYQAMKISEKENIPLTDDLIEKCRKNNCIPIENDFRLA